MTCEHKILHLVDRGLISRHDLPALCGRGANREGLDLIKDGLLEFTKAPYLTLTALGLERLNGLDAFAAKGMVQS